MQRHVVPSIASLFIVCGCSGDGNLTLGPDSPAECDPDQVESFPTGEPAWSQQDIDACAAVCPDADESCRREQCPDSDAHDACLLDSLEACLTLLEATCREPWEAYSCCSESCDDGHTSDVNLRRCIERECGVELQAYADCVDAAVEAEDSCLSEAETLCLLP
jgi:hypothetical protein